jgi:predicted ester cyclase
VSNRPPEEQVLQRHLIVVNVPRIAFAAEREISNASLFSPRSKIQLRNRWTRSQRKARNSSPSSGPKSGIRPTTLDTIDRLCTEDFVITNAGIDIVGRAAFKEWINAFTSKIREPRLVSHDMFSSLDGSRVVSRWTVTGFNRGMFDTPADDRPVQFTGIAIWEVRNGKLAHNWIERSAYELSQQLKKISG